MNEHLPELELIKQCIAGKRRYQELLYKKFSRKMMGICFRYSKNREEAEDFLQDAFIKIFGKLGQYKGEGSLEGWLRTIVLHTVFESRRKNTRIFFTDINEISPAEADDGINDTIAHDELLSYIQDLPPGCRTVFNMFAVDGYSHREISSLLNIHEGTSKSQLSLARKLLRKRIAAPDHIRIRS
jgi:RNA polymerase sigma factor (sigma-70 family)